MASHNRLGAEAEEMAVNYLAGKGYEIIRRNWRHRHLEIDIIAVRNKVLRIIEVKALKRSDVKFPEESVTRKKFRFIQMAADEFLYQHREYRHVQFDILSIIAHPGEDPEFYLIEDVSF